MDRLRELMQCNVHIGWRTSTPIFFDFFFFHFFVARFNLVTMYVIAAVIPTFIVSIGNWHSRAQNGTYALWKLSNRKFGKLYPVCARAGMCSVCHKLMRTEFVTLHYEWIHTHIAPSTVYLNLILLLLFWAELRLRASAVHNTPNMGARLEPPFVARRISMK